MPCAYCGQRAFHKDHVVPKSIAKRYPDLPEELKATVFSCGNCNWRKLNRRLVPPSWAHLIPLLNELIPGTDWRVWTGDVREPAFAEVHV